VGPISIGITKHQTNVHGQPLLLQSNLLSSRSILAQIRQYPSCVSQCSDVPSVPPVVAGSLESAQTIGDNCGHVTVLLMPLKHLGSQSSFKLFFKRPTHVKGAVDNGCSVSTVGLNHCSEHCQIGNHQYYLLPGEAFPPHL
jgi:hypothetical protein